RQRRRTMLVDHPARGGLERRRHRRRRLRHVVVDERLELRRLVAEEKRVDKEEDLGLALAQVAHELHEEAEIALLTADGRRWRMLARGGEIDAVRRTLDLGQPLRSAADRTDLFAERRTCTSSLPLATERANHGSTIV